jgi:hypothetical protein
MAAELKASMVNGIPESKGGALLLIGLVAGLS